MKKNNCQNCRDCNKVITLNQITGTCWFNALLMSIFYSDGMSKLLMKKQHVWKIDKNLEKIFIKMIYKNYKNYSYDIPEYILTKLLENNSKDFPFNPKEQQGYWPILYLPQFLKYLSINNQLMLEYNDNNLYYSIYHGDYSIKLKEVKNAKKIDEERNNGTRKKYRTYITPEYKKSYKPNNIDSDVIIIIYDSYNNVSTHKENLYLENYKLSETITHNNHIYKLDSLLLTNFNHETCNKSHMICGITCNNKRYIYNGWTKYYETNNPCELIQYDWLNNDSQFCLNKDKCKLDIEDRKEDLCFDVKKGVRNYIYVKISEKNNSNSRNTKINNNAERVRVNDNNNNNNLEKNINSHFYIKITPSIFQAVRDLDTDSLENQLKDTTFIYPQNIRDKNAKDLNVNDGNFFTVLSENYVENISQETFLKINAISKLLLEKRASIYNGGLFSDILMNHKTIYDRELLETFSNESISRSMNMHYKIGQNIKVKSKESALTICLKEGNLEIIKIFFDIFFKEEWSYYYSDDNENNLLHIASFRKNKDDTLSIIKFLMSKHSFDVNQKNNDNKTAYDLLVENNKDISKEILFLTNKNINFNNIDTNINKKDKNINLRNKNVNLNNIDTNVNKKDKNIDLKNKNIDTNVNKKDRNININKKHNLKNVSVNINTINKIILNVDVIQMKDLLNKGLNPNKIYDNKYLLEECLSYPNTLPIMRLLIDTGADPYLGEILVLIFYDFIDLSYYKFFMSLKLDIYKYLHGIYKNDNLLTLCAKIGSFDKLSILLSTYDINPKFTDENNNTLIHLCVAYDIIAGKEENVIQKIKLLITKGADVNVKNIFNETAYDTVIKYNKLSLLKLLTKKRIKNINIDKNTLANTNTDKNLLHSNLRSNTNTNKNLLHSNPRTNTNIDSNLSKFSKNINTNKNSNLRLNTNKNTHTNTKKNKDKNIINNNGKYVSEKWDHLKKDKILNLIKNAVNFNEFSYVDILTTYGWSIHFKVFKEKESVIFTYVYLNDQIYTCYKDTFFDYIDKLVQNNDTILVIPGKSLEIIESKKTIIDESKKRKTTFDFVSDISEIIKNKNLKKKKINFIKK